VTFREREEVMHVKIEIAERPVTSESGYWKGH
jgi:hypothetical protein